MWSDIYPTNWISRKRLKRTETFRVHCSTFELDSIMIQFEEFFFHTKRINDYNQYHFSGRINSKNLTSNGWMKSKKREKETEKNNRKHLPNIKSFMIWISVSKYTTLHIVIFPFHNKYNEQNEQHKTSYAYICIGQ